MREISTTVTAGQGSEKHNHDLDYRSTLTHVHSRENGVIELVPYRDYREQINAMAKPYIDAYNEKQQQRYQAAWDRYNAGEIKTKPRKANYQPLGYDYYNDHLTDTYHNRKTGQDEVQPMWRSLIIGLGDKADRTEGRITEEEAIKIFTDVINDFRKDFPHFHLLGASIHLDEEGFYHCHLDYKPFYEHDIGQGLGIGIGQDSALAAMGFTPEQSIINGRDKAPLLFNAMRNQIYRSVEAAMADQKIRLQYGVSSTKDPGKDSSRNQSLEIWQATQDNARELQHQKNIALDVISQDEVSPEGYKKAKEAIKNIESTLQQVKNSPLTVTRKDYKVSFTLFDQLQSMVQNLNQTMVHIFHQLDILMDRLDEAEPLADEAQAYAAKAAQLERELEEFRKKKALEETIRKAKDDPSLFEILLDLVLTVFQSEPEIHEQYRPTRRRYTEDGAEIIPTRMDWDIQKRLDELCGTDYARQDMARHFGWDYKPKSKDEDVEYEWISSP